MSAAVAGPHECRHVRLVHGHLHAIDAAADTGASLIEKLRRMRIYFPSYVRFFSFSFSFSLVLALLFVLLFYL
jgi:hypothetical protein